MYIQDVILPAELVEVLTRREIANQEIETFKMQQKAQEQRVATEATTGKADMQRDLAKSAIGIDIRKNNADSRMQEARGESEYIKQTGTAQADVIRAQGTAQADVIRAQGLSKAEGFRAQNEAIGSVTKYNPPGQYRHSARGKRHPARTTNPSRRRWNRS